jgi:hypothetical protein
MLKHAANRGSASYRVLLYLSCPPTRRVKGGPPTWCSVGTASASRWQEQAEFRFRLLYGSRWDVLFHIPVRVGSEVPNRRDVTGTHRRQSDIIHGCDRPRYHHTFSRAGR